MNATIAKYLARAAEPEARLLAEGLPGPYRAALCVPVLGESPDFLDGYGDALAAAGGRVLLVVVVNASVETAASLREQNATLVAGLSAGAEWLSPAAALLRRPGVDLLLIERSGAGRELPAREGVGLARKIGGDLALAVFARGALDSPFLHCTDADTSLPGDYFQRAGAQCAAGASGLVYPFRHVVGADPAVHRATARYEASLRYHVLGLAWAGSPYAYHSLGSALAVRLEAYAAVRGVPKRAAGEDFYLLDKLAKVGKIQRLGGAPLQIASRRSLRVPFGTGPRVESLLKGEQLLVASPDAFLALRAVLAGIDRASLGGAPLATSLSFAEVPTALRAATRAAADACGLASAIADAAREVGKASLRRRLHTWFDALRTLRLLHAVRDAGVSEVPVEAALREAPFCPAGVGSFEEGGLARLREAEAEWPSELGPALLV